MVDLLKPPTDNLYKFAAIFGLVLIVVGFVFPPWVFYRSSLEYLKSLAGEDELNAYKKFADERSRTLDARTQQARDELDQIQKQRDSLQTNTITSSETERLESAIRDAKKQLEILEDASQESTLNLELKTAQAKQQRTFSANESRNARILMYLGWSLAAIGGLFSIVGFGLWYLNVQRHLDHILQKEAKSKITAAPRPESPN